MNIDSTLKALDIYKVIEARHSVRTFTGEELQEKVMGALREFIRERETPFGSDAKLLLLDSVLAGVENTGGLTRGCAKNARYFLMVTVPEDAKLGMCQAGFLLERAILFATALGLSACIMGGTVDHKKFEDFIKLKSGHILPLIAPLGVCAEKESVRGTLLNKFSKGGKRKELEDICFDTRICEPLNHFAVGEYYSALESVRLAPSARNKQPWRIVLKDGKFSFFKEISTGKELFAAKYDMHEADMGIAMCHFYYASLDEGIMGSFAVEDAGILTEDERVEYIATFVPQAKIEDAPTVQAEENKGGD